MGVGGKLGFAGKLAAGVAYLVQGENEAFGLSTFTDSVVLGDEGKGRFHLMDTVQSLEGLEAGGETDVLGAVEEFEAFLDSRSLVVMISDFMDELEQVKDAVHLLGDHDLILLQVVAPGEARPDFDGNLELRDSETGEEVEVFFSEGTRKRYRNLVNRQASEVDEASREVSGDHLAFASSRPPLDAMFDIVSRRETGGP